MIPSPRLSRAPEPLNDPPGYDLKPDPLTATTAAQFCDCLRDYRVWAGEPSLRRMAHACRQRVSAATLQRVLAGSVLPGLEQVLAVIEGCGGSIADQERFMEGWRRIRLAAETLADREAGSA